MITMTSLLVMWGLVFSIPSFSTDFIFAANAGDDDEEEAEETPEQKAKREAEEKKKEEEAEEIEDEVDDLAKDLEKIEKEKAAKEQTKLSIAGEIGAIKSDIATIEGEIQATENEIVRLETGIVEALDDIAAKKKLTGEVLRQINRTNRDLQLIAYSSEEGLNEYFTTVDNFENMEDRLSKLIVEIREKKDSLEQDRISQKEMIAVHEEQKKELEYRKNKKGYVLTQTQEAINKDSAKIEKIQTRISNMKSAISSLLGKGYDASDIVDAVKFASKRTGVRKEFLMAMLDKETDLGRFTGGCTYKNTRVKAADAAEFKKICKELGYDYKKKKISCSLSYGYGGAMGVAQFMPTTWIGYKKAIAGYTGHNPPDPWNLTDGVVGMAEKLRRSGASSKSKEHFAAKSYYCGGPGSAYWNNKCEDYADTVISWAKSGYDDMLN